MPPVYRQANVSARCPGCNGALSTFVSEATRLGTVIRDERHTFDGKQYTRYLYILMRCGGCGRGGLAEIHDNGGVMDGTMSDFYPVSIEHAQLPPNVPESIVREFREAEQCEGHGAYRGASALLRSTLEKTLKANGYTKGSLEDKIDEAAADGIITGPHRNKAHDDIRALGNEVVHDDWRAIAPTEIEVSHRYAQRIVEDFYDVRSEVEKIVTPRLQRHVNECDDELKLLTLAADEVSKHLTPAIAKYIQRYIKRQTKRVQAEFTRLEKDGIRPEKP